jgi:hypothetical protein
MKNVLIILTAIILAACASSGVMVDQSKVDKFQKGVTTEADVYGALGKPTTVTVSNGMKILTYVGSQAQLKAASFIPVVGLFAGGADVRASVLSLTFKDGVLSNIVSSQTQSDVRNGSGVTE